MSVSARFRRRLHAGLVSAGLVSTGLLGAAVGATALGAAPVLAAASDPAAAADAGTAAGTPAAAAAASAAPRRGTVPLQLLAVNDFHGALEPPTGSSSSLPGAEGPLGGVEHLAAQIAQREVGKEKTSLVVAAGDLIGASPLLSAAFHDEPTIEALGLAGLDVATVGNHEFDEGAAELTRIARGGCHPVDGCSDPDRPYRGARFDYLSANAFRTEDGDTLLPPYKVRRVRGIPVGFIGVTLEGTPDVVTPSGVAGLRFGDEAATVNRYTRELQARGVQAIVVLMHEGGFQTGPDASYDGCAGISGPVVDIVERMSDAVDVVITGHTHQAYNCEIDDRLVTSASSFGRLVTDIDLRLSRATGDVRSARAENVLVTRDLPPDPRQTALIARYRRLLGPVAGRVVGTASTAVPRTAEPLPGVVSASGIAMTGESPLGDLIADAQLAATDDEQGAVAAFMNPGGVRADLDAGPITYEEAFTVQPFNNFLSTYDLTGAQVQCLLEQQFAVGRVLQPSAGVSYTVDPAGTSGTVAEPCSGTRVLDDSVRLGGRPVTAGGTYRITTNNFLADGGDGFTVLRDAADRADSGYDVDALVAYLAGGPVSAPATDRITVG